MDIELARAAAYEQLKMLFEKYSFDKKCFPSIYARDWRLCYEVLQKEGGQLYDVVGVTQKQAAKLLHTLLDVDSTLEVYGAASEPYKASLLDAKNELDTLKSLVRERGAALSEQVPDRKVKPETILKDGRRVRQIQIIMSVIKELGYDPKSIPDEGKNEIRKVCISKHSALFTLSSFDHAWKSEPGRQLFCTVDKERFKKRG